MLARFVVDLVRTPVCQRTVLENPCIDHQAEVLRPGALDEVDVAIDHFMLDRCRGVDFRADYHPKLLGEIKVALGVGFPLRLGDQVVREHAELRAQELEAELVGKAQITLEFGRAFLDREIALQGDAHVDPRAHVGWLKLVLVEQAEPAVEKLAGGVGIAFDLPLAKDLDASGTSIGDVVERVFQRHDRAVVIDVAVG